jgi:hypothetical protein
MKKNKVVIILIGIIVVLFVVICAIASFFLVSKKSSDFDNKTEKTQSLNTASETKENDKKVDKEMVDNYVKCKVDNQQVDFKMMTVTYFTSMNTTSFLASGTSGAGSTMQLSFPGQKAGTFKDSATSSEVGIHYGSTGTESYQSFYENGQTTINISKYSGNQIEGNYTGTVIYLDMNGRDANRKHSVDCSFKASVAIKTM